MTLYQRGKTWRAEFYFNDAHGHKTVLRENLGRDISRATAEKIYAARMTEILMGVRGLSSKDMPIEECLDTYLALVKRRVKLKLGKKSRRKSTLVGYKECRRNLLLEFAGKRISEITEDRLRAWSDSRESTPIAFNRGINFLSICINYAIKKGLYTGINPTLDVERFEEKSIKRALGKTEFKEILLASASHIVPILLIAVYQGIRLTSQILTLKKSDIDLENGFLTARATNAKNKKDLRLPIRKELIEVFREQLKVSECEWLFTHPHNPKERLKSIRTALKRARERSGVAPFRCHDLRHTFGTWLAQEGVPISTIMEVGGWSKLETVQIYLNPSDTHKREALNRVPWIGPKPITVDTPPTTEKVEVLEQERMSK